MLFVHYTASGDSVNQHLRQFLVASSCLAVLISSLGLYFVVQVQVQVQVQLLSGTFSVGSFVYRYPALDLGSFSGNGRMLETGSCVY